MTASTSALNERFVANFCSDDVLAAIEKVRSVNEEVAAEVVEAGVTGRHFDRRRSRRVQFRMPITLIPVSEDSLQSEIFNVVGAEQIAMTRDLSSMGLGILHDMPLLADFAVVQFDIPGEADVELLYEIRWSVRKTQFSYMTGGRLTGVVASVIDSRTGSS